MYSIYVHTFPNGKTYVGITMRDVSIRWGNGNNYTNCRAVNRAIKKYGWENIKHDVVKYQNEFHFWDPKSETHFLFTAEIECSVK